jgi:hypothetical protein
VQDFWPSSGFALLEPTPRGWLRPTDAYLRLWLGLPELAVVAESCAAERALHDALDASPSRPVAAAELASLADADVRSNYAMFLAFRDALLNAGTLEAYYLGLFRAGPIGIPPLFIDRIVHALVHRLMHDCTDAIEARAAELLFRPQRISIVEGQTLCADLETVDHLDQTAGLGDLGRLLVQNKAPVRAAQMAVLGPDTAADYWRQAERHAFVLDLTHEVANDVGHGLSFTMRRTHSGLAALARVLEKWIAHLLGVEVRITPLQRIDDPAWRWHVGLDAEASALLDDLYEQRDVEPQRLQRLLGLFRLEFADPREMRTDVAGKPVYLGLATTPSQTLRLKPQNLLLNLPLATPS